VPVMTERDVPPDVPAGIVRVMRMSVTPEAVVRPC
jgi:hypothetical protein